MSTIRGVNLLPLERRRSARRRSRTRLWAVIGAAWAAAIVAVYVPFAATKQREDAAIEVGMSQVAQRIEGGRRTLASLRAGNSASRMTLVAARAVAEHPDWSVLLDMLARTRGENIVLERVELAAVAAPPTGGRAQLGAAPEAPAQPAGLVITIEGVGDSPSAVTDFTLSMERSGLFDRVNLADTKARTLRGIGRTSFRLQCSVEPAKAGRPTP